MLLALWGPANHKASTLCSGAGRTSYDVDQGNYLGCQVTTLCCLATEKLVAHSVLLH